MSLPQAILFATGNAHKIREVAAILAPIGLTVHGLETLGRVVQEPVEDGRTFLANATLKARYYAKHAGGLVLAEDSGLVVDALGGAPGVHSARYSGMDRPRNVVDPANNTKLLYEMRDVPQAQRTARFVCTMVLADPSCIWATARGTIEGRIAHQPAGTHGFGYDPLFFIPERNCTSAQLSPEEKNAISHRGSAARLLAHALAG